MKKYFGDISAGFIWGTVFLAVPNLISGLYGFLLADTFVNKIPTLGNNMFLLVLILYLAYIMVSLPVFILYTALPFYKKMHQEINLKSLFLSFLFFSLGILIVLIFYFVVGILAFSRGQFSL